jgi:hypothetical protein
MENDRCYEAGAHHTLLTTKYSVDRALLTTTLSHTLHYCVSLATGSYSLMLS